MKYPCVLPEVQIDNCFNPVLQKTANVKELAKQIFFHGHMLLCKSLLRGLQKGTLAQIEQALVTLHQEINPKVENGQIYIHNGWRLRWEDMHEGLRALVNNVRLHDDPKFKKELLLRFQPEKVEQHVFHAIGPARAAGVRALRLHQRAGLRSPHLVQG